jgi:hypothetical protein
MQERVLMFHTGQRVRHVRTGGVYAIIFTPDECCIESSFLPAYAYRLVDNPKNGPVWIRSRVEMEDGRFEPVEETPTNEAQENDQSTEESSGSEAS